jgi:hypothetical protein
VLQPDDHGAEAGRDLPHAGDRADRRQPGDGPGPLPAATALRGLPLTAGGSVALEGGRTPLRMGPADRALDTTDPRPGRGRPRAHRPRARRGEPHRVRLVQQPAGDADAQPQAGRAPEDAEAAHGPWRRRGGPPGRGLGLDPRCDRGGGRPDPGGRPQRLDAAPPLPLAPRAGPEGDPLALPTGDDRRDQLQRRAERPADRRGDPALRPARVAAPCPHPDRRGLLVARSRAAPAPAHDRG